MGSGTICVVWGWFYRRAIESANSLVQIWLRIRKLPFFKISLRDFKESKLKILQQVHPVWARSKSTYYLTGFALSGRKKFLFGRGHWVVWQLSHRLTTADQHKVHQHFSYILLPQHFFWCKHFAVYYWILLKKINVMLNGQRHQMFS